ncbi:MAG: thioether cross-link-forming SCIFF peptide maturase, partial [Oscillospiraceae bacterium]|nr:thioether cross-link-forming SCIFF peptide maturase [Oscillospiraceae bacterium]
MIHKYTLNGYRIVMDVNSGAVHLFDEIPYAMLDYLEDSVPQEMPQEMHKALREKYDEEAIQEAYSDLRELYQEDILFSDEGDYAKLANLLVDAPIKSMCLNISHDCNLRCEYCFAAKGDFGCGRKLMPFEVAKSAIDFLVEKSKGRHNLEVDFFGGEPLMNFDVVKQTVEYARSIEKEKNKNFRFTLTTNGLLLNDEIIDYLNREMHNVVLSLDGRKEVNDRLRVRTDGTGCYDTIVPKYQKLVANRGDKDYYVRGTFTTHNLDFAEDAVHIADLGFKQLSIEPVVSDPKLDYSLKEENLPAAFAEYERLANIILERRKTKNGFNFF